MPLADLQFFLVHSAACIHFGFAKSMEAMAEAASEKESKVFLNFKGLGPQWDDSSRIRTRVKEIQRVVVDKPPEDQKEQAPEGAVARTLLNAP